MTVCLCVCVCACLCVWGGGFGSIERTTRVHSRCQNCCKHRTCHGTAFYTRGKKAVTKTLKSWTFNTKADKSIDSVKMLMLKSPRIGHGTKQNTLLYCLQTKLIMVSKTSLLENNYRYNICLQFRSGLMISI